MTTIQATSALRTATALSAAASGNAPVGTIGGDDPATTTPTTDGLSRLDQDVFLKLLVAQMKYQDPTNPTDPTQFLTQTAQFTVVEKLDALSTLNQKVLDASNAQSAASMLGRTVTWTDVSGTSRTGVVTATSFGSQTPTLTVGGTSVSLDDVTSIAT
jgi:flagellar basal-body rod modification protein FlgD